MQLYTTSIFLCFGIKSKNKNKFLLTFFFFGQVLLTFLYMKEKDHEQWDYEIRQLAIDNVFAPTYVDAGKQNWTTIRQQFVVGKNFNEVVI